MKTVDLQKVRSLRKGHKLSQAEMANVLGFNSMWPYHRKEKGSQDFSASEIGAIAVYFNKPVEYFFVNVVAKNATKKSKEVS